MTRAGSQGGGLIGGLSWLVGCWLELNFPWDLSGPTSTPESIASIRRATFLWGSAGSAGLLGSSSSVIAASLRLLLLLTAVMLDNSDAFFRSVSLPIQLGFKARVSKLPRRVKACLLGDGEKPASETASESDSDSSTSGEWLRCTAPVPWAVLSVHYGASGAPKMTAPHPFSPPRPAQRPGAEPFFFHSPPPPPARAPAPFVAPDRSPSPYPPIRGPGQIPSKLFTRLGPPLSFYYLPRFSLS